MVSRATEKINHSVITSMLLLGEMIQQTQTSKQTRTAQEPLLVSAFPPVALVPGCSTAQPSLLAEAFAKEHINPGSDPPLPAQPHPTSSLLFLPAL